jgi:MFS family permease
MRSTKEKPENCQAARSFLRPMAAVFSVFLVTGAALPVIPRHIHSDLGFGVFVVGLVSGGQYVVALASRLWAGAVSDRRGPKFAVMTGLVMVAIAGAFYLLSWAVPNSPLLSVAILLVGRAVLSGAESFSTIGAQSWSLGLLPIGNAGCASCAFCIAYSHLAEISSRDRAGPTVTRDC